MNDYSNEYIMKIYIAIIIILLGIVLAYNVPRPKTVESSGDIEVRIIREGGEEVYKYENLVRQYSEQYGVSYALMSAIMDAENLSRNPNLQSQLLYGFTNASLGIYYGEQEYSFGLVQINLHYNPNITMSQATDPEYSIEFLAKHLSLGHHSMWGSYTSGAYLVYMNRHL